LRSSSRATATTTPRQLIRNAARRFKAAGLVYGHGTLNASDEAAWLMVHALRRPFEHLPDLLDQPLKPAQVRLAEQLFSRRISKRTPAAYLTGEAWLGEFRFHVDERVIVPRSYIAELLRTRMRPWLKPREHPRRILDLCTGSGCLAIIAAHVFPDARVEGSDVSKDALTVARRNVRDYRLGARVHLKHSNLFQALQHRTYDLILSNPPYVRTAVMRTLPAEYRREPSLALGGGDDGLDLVRTILRDAASHLNPRGWLVIEVGHNRQRVERAFPSLPFIWAETSGGDDCVALLQREALIADQSVPAPPTRKAASRRRRTPAR